VTAAAPVTPVPNLGLTTLLLPMPEVSLVECHTCAAPWPKENQAVPPVADESAQALYRWLLGHHGAFCLWRLTSEFMSAMENGWHGAAGTVAALVDAYSALLLYAGRCSPHVYGTVIRPAMIAMNPAFSGTWAWDYEHISARLRRLERSGDSAGLQQALRFVLPGGSGNGVPARFPGSVPAAVTIGRRGHQEEAVGRPVRPRSAEPVPVAR
jgi:hypothetical protein